MDNPIVKVDLREHPYYTTHEYTKWMANIWTAEILMLNTNKETMRVRLYDSETNEKVYSNLDLSVHYIIEEEIIIKL